MARRHVVVKVADLPEARAVIAELDHAVRLLAYAVQKHRTDMHLHDDRPCQTCTLSANALRTVGVEPYVHDGRQSAFDALEDAAKAKVTHSACVLCDNGDEDHMGPCVPPTQSASNRAVAGTQSASHSSSGVVPSTPTPAPASTGDTP